MQLSINFRIELYAELSENLNLESIEVLLTMAKILIADLQSIGSNLFSDSENFLDSMQDLSENELKMNFGGKKHGSQSKSKKTKSKSNSYSNGCNCVCGGTGGGTGGGN